jgi:hypothetical protein
MTARVFGPRRLTFASSILVMTAIFVLSLPAVTARIYASDEVEFFSWLRSWTFDRDVDFQNEYQHFYETGQAENPGFHATFLEQTNEAGRRINFAPVGCAVLWAPFYLAGHVAAIVTGAPANGLSQPYVTAVAYGSACYGLIAVLLSAAIARAITGRGLGAAIAVGLGTPLLFYIYVTPIFSHASSAFAVALFLWTWLKARGRWSLGGVVLLGLTGGLMAMVREQDVFFVAGPAIDFLRWSVRPSQAAPGTGRPAPRASAVLATAGLASFALAYLPQFLAYNALNGHPGPTVLVTRKMTWTAPHAFQVLFSPEHGFLAWTPLAVLAFAGLGLLAFGRRQGSDARWIGALAILMVLLQVYVSGAVESWTVAGSFGQRRFVALTPLLTLGLAALTAAVSERARPWRWTPGILIVLCLWWNLGLMAQFGLHTMDRQRLTLQSNARATFLQLPFEGPRLVWRYLTDRASFYGLPRQ